MKNATISHLKNHLSRYLRYVKEGESVIILDRGYPIAEILPKQRSSKKEDNYLIQLEARGIIRRGDSRKLKNFSFPSLNKKTGVLETLLNERKEGR